MANRFTRRGRRRDSHAEWRRPDDSQEPEAPSPRAARTPPVPGAEPAAKHVESRPRPEQVGPILSADGLVRTYPGRVGVIALKGVSISLDRGDFVALMGPSGSGKTTLLGLLSGLDRPEQGRVHWHGVPLDELGPQEHRALRRSSIGVVFQNFGLLPTLSAQENVELPLRVAGETVGRAGDEARRWLERLGLGDRLGNRTFELSAGQQQRVAVARALVTGPEVVLADEPIAEVDTENADLILDALADVSRRGGAVLAATHNPAALSYAGRVVLLRDGAVEATGTPDEMAGHISTD
jgi:putative ABC transport system ATP-binding protein